MILLKNLNKSFDKNVLNDINVEIPDGSIVGLIGMNGTAGERTSKRMIAKANWLPMKPHITVAMMPRRLSIPG